MVHHVNMTKFWNHTLSLPLQGIALSSRPNTSGAWSLCCSSQRILVLLEFSYSEGLVIDFSIVEGEFCYVL